MTSTPVSPAVRDLARREDVRRSAENVSQLLDLEPAAVGQAEACPPIAPDKAHGLDRVDVGIRNDKEGFVAQSQTSDVDSVRNAVPGQVAAHIAGTAEEAPLGAFEETQRRRESDGVE